LTKTELAVGDSTWIELIYTMGQHSRKTTKRATVTTNDTTTGRVTISFSGEGWLDSDTTIMLDLNPRILDFGPLGKKRRTKLEAKIKNLSQEKMTLSIIGVPPDLFEEVKLSKGGFLFSRKNLSPKDKIKPKETAKLEVKLKKETEDQRFQKSITLEAKGDSLTYRFTVPVKKGFESKVAKKTPKPVKKKPGEK
jgi:hypothetical protein